MRYPLHIMIEGVDNVGKTTVCKILSQRLGLLVTYMPFTKDYWSAGQMENASRLYNEVLCQFSSTSFIMDRGYLSSLVYSEVFQRQTNLDYIKSIELALRPYIFVLTDSDLEKLRTRRDEIIPSKSIDAIQLVYERLALERGYFIVPVNNNTPDAVVDVISQYLRA